MPSFDRFSKFKPDLDSPIYDANNVTPSNSTVLVATRAVFVGTSGNVTVQMVGYENSNTVVTFKNVPSGTLLPIRVTKIFASTNASTILALY